MMDYLSLAVSSLVAWKVTYEDTLQTGTVQVVCYSRVSNMLLAFN